MKKVIYLFVLVFATSMAMSQNTATVNQYGTNFSEIKQTGSSNDATVNQGTALKAANNPLINSTYFKSGAWVEQIGNGNGASISSQYDGSAYNSGSSNAGSIYQKGDVNEASQVLSAASSLLVKLSERVAIEIDQIGDGNDAHQRTRANFGTYGIRQMWIDQKGTDNYANQYSNGGTQSVMTIKQNGSGNGNAITADISLTGLSSPLSLAWGTKMHAANRGGIDAGKISSGEYTQYQNGNGAKAIIDIDGDNNKTSQSQEFTVWGQGNNTAEIYIVGSLNAVIQGQMGQLNNSNVDIDGSSNVATTSQEGNSNVVEMDILGSLNTAGVQQTGDFHSATVFQNGDSNFAKVVQHF